MLDRETKKRERKIKTQGIHHHEHEKRVSTKATYSKSLISQTRYQDIAGIRAVWFSHKSGSLWYAMNL